MTRPQQRTKLGRYYVGSCEELLSGHLRRQLRGKVQLIFTSPPYPLNRKKSYGNLNGDKYREWFVRLAPLFAELLTDDGSIVIELGNAWLPGRPVQSLLHLKSLIGFVEHPEADLRLCQQFVCYNPARLPSPAAWVTVRKDRVTDALTHVWWMSKTDFPKADNRKVLRPYSRDMLDLLEKQSYNNGRRPSSHDVSREGFLKDRGGSTAQNFFEMEALEPDRVPRLPNALSFANTRSNDFFFRECRKNKIRPHPARMPVGLASFFIEFLTERKDLVLDPFGGSNTTGYAAELAGRRWISIEKRREYVRQSRIRFRDPLLAKRRKRTRRTHR